MVVMLFQDLAGVTGRAGMRIFSAVLVGLCVLMTGGSGAYGQEAAKLPSGTPTPRPEGKDWVDLLDADHLPGWKSNVNGKQPFQIEDSLLYLPGQTSGTFAVYAGERLRDFSLHIEFKVGTLVNSGVILRAEMDNPPLTGLELQILDDFGRPPTKTSCGALYDVATPMFNMSNPAGQWNSYDITCQGRLLTVYMNGWKILEVDLGKMTMPLGKYPVPLAQMATDGFICLEDRGGETWFRNIMLKKL